MYVCVYVCNTNNLTVIFFNTFSYNFLAQRCNYVVKFICHLNECNSTIAPRFTATALRLIMANSRSVATFTRATTVEL